MQIEITKHQAKKPNRNKFLFKPSSSSSFKTSSDTHLSTRSKNPIVVVCSSCVERKCQDPVSMKDEYSSWISSKQSFCSKEVSVGETCFLSRPFWRPKPIHTDHAHPRLCVLHSYNKNQEGLFLSCLLTGLVSVVS